MNEPDKRRRSPPIAREMGRNVPYQRGRVAGGSRDANQSDCRRANKYRAPQPPSAGSATTPLKRKCSDTGSGPSSAGPSKMPRHGRSSSPPTGPSSPYKHRLPPTRPFESHRTTDPRLARPPPSEPRSRILSGSAEQVLIHGRKGQGTSLVPTAGPGPPLGPKFPAVRRRPSTNASGRRTPSQPQVVNPAPKVITPVQPTRPNIVGQKDPQTSVPAPSPVALANPPSCAEPDPDDMEMSGDETDVKTSSTSAAVEMAATMVIMAMDSSSATIPDRPKPRLPLLTIPLAEEATVQVPTSAASALDRMMVDSPAASVTSTILERRKSCDEGSTPTADMWMSLSAIVKPLATAVRYRVECENIEKDIRFLNSSEFPKPSSSTASPVVTTTVIPPETPRTCDPRRALKGPAQPSTSNSSDQFDAAIKKLEHNRRCVSQKYNAQIKTVESQTMAMGRASWADIEGKIHDAIKDALKDHPPSQPVEETALGLQLDGTAENQEIAVGKRCDDLESWMRVAMGELNQKCQDAFDTMTEDRRELVKGFEAKVEEVGEFFPRSTDFVALSKKANDTAKDVDWLERDVICHGDKLNKLHATTGDTDQRLKVMEIEWAAFRPFEKEPGEQIELSSVSTRQTLRGQLESLGSFLRADMDAAKVTTLEQVDAMRTSAFAKLEGVETSLLAKLDAVEASTIAKGDLANTSILNELEILKASVNAKVDIVKSSMSAELEGTRSSILAKVAGVETGVLAEVSKAKTSLTAKIDTMDACQRQQFITMQTAHQQQINDLQASQQQQATRLDSKIDAICAENKLFIQALAEERAARLEAEAKHEALTKAHREQIELLEAKYNKTAGAVSDCHEDYESLRYDVLELGKHAHADRQLRVKLTELIARPPDEPSPPMGGGPCGQPGHHQPTQQRGRGLGVHAKSEYGSPDALAGGPSSDASWSGGARERGRTYADGAPF